MFELQIPWINYCWINCLFFMDQVSSVVILLNCLTN